MKRTFHLFTMACLLSAGVSLASPSVGAASSYETASIIPAGTSAVGSSLAYGLKGERFGWGLMANGITDLYTASDSVTPNFLVLFCSNVAISNQKITFTVVSPTGATVYSNTTAFNVPRGGEFGIYSAKGNYSKTGTYFAQVHVGKILIGSIPLVFAK